MYRKGIELCITHKEKYDLTLWNKIWHKLFLTYNITVLIKLLDGDELLKLLSIDLLQDYSNKFSLEDSEIFSIAKKIHSTFPVIVTEEDLFSIGYRLKCQLNENSKMLSYNITYPRWTIMNL